MNKAVFLDRDGVLCKELDRYLQSVDEFELLPHVIPNLKRLKQNGFLLVMISNQGVIARGELKLEEVNAMHKKMQRELSANGVAIDALYFCPHHPEISACLCRKPEPLLIEKALARFGVDSSASFMIGDSPRDVEAAERAGVKGVMVGSNDDWTHVVDRILEDS